MDCDHPGTQAWKEQQWGELGLEVDQAEPLKGGSRSEEASGSAWVPHGVRKGQGPRGTGPGWSSAATAA